MSLFLLQGLCGDRLVTQGWGAFVTAPASRLVLQGLGSEALVVQGLGLLPGGPPQASGGLAHGGAATAAWQGAPKSSGGLASGGAAPAQYAAFTPSAGGIAQGGQSPSAWQWSPAICVGLALGGCARLPRHEAIVGSGGLAHGGAAAGEFVVYVVYGNAGLDDPIDYAIPRAVVGDTTWTSGPLAVPGSYRFAVRARNAVSGLEEENLDAAVVLVLDAEGNDVTFVPPPPLGLRGFALAGGAIRVEWSCPCGDPRREPAGFHVYLGADALAEGSPPAATVPWTDAVAGGFGTTLTGLTDGVSYAINVRAYNRYGEETNSRVIVVSADGTPPAPVDGLAAAPTALES